MSIADKLTQIAENEQKVYKAGRDVVWDGIQRNGERTDYNVYTGFFHGSVYGFDNFYPTHDIRPVGTAAYLFYNWGTRGEGSLSARLEECGIVLDTSNVTDFRNAFAYSHITEIPTIDCRNFNNNTINVFFNSFMQIKNIEKLIVNENTTFSSWFANTLPIEIRFEGVIGQDLSITYSNGLEYLSIESMKNIISCLKNYKGTDEEFAHTLTFHESYWTRLEADSTAPDGGTWREYVGSLGWNT